MARTSAVLAVVPSDRANPSGSAGSGGAATARPRLPIPLAELVLCRADLGQQCYRIETAIGLAQPPLDGLGQLGMSQRSLVRRRWRVIALDDLCTLAALLLELERRLEEVHVQPRRRVKTCHHAGRLYSVKAAVAYASGEDPLPELIRA